MKFHTIVYALTRAPADPENPGPCGSSSGRQAGNESDQKRKEAGQKRPQNAPKLGQHGPNMHPQMVKLSSREASGRSLASLGAPGRPKSDFSAILELNRGSILDAKINKHGVRIEA